MLCLYHALCDSSVCKQEITRESLSEQTLISVAILCLFTDACSSSSIQSCLLLLLLTTFSDIHSQLRMRKNYNQISSYILENLSLSSSSTQNNVYWLDTLNLSSLSKYSFQRQPPVCIVEPTCCTIPFRTMPFMGVPADSFPALAGRFTCYFGPVSFHCHRGTKDWFKTWATYS